MKYARLFSLLSLLAFPPAVLAVDYDLTWRSVDGGGATFLTGGTFTLGGTTGQADPGRLTGGSFEVNGGLWATRNHVVLTLVGSASAAPNPAAINTAVSFDVADSMPSATITWNFGDGSPAATGAPVTHAYAAPGAYSATLTIEDVASGQLLTQTVDLSIGTVDDVDSDGFINELETALGTDPLDPDSTPFGGAPAGTPQSLAIAKTSVSLNFAKAGKDAIRLTGRLPIAAGFSAQNQAAVVFFGGVTKTFTLDAKGNAHKGGDTFGIKIKAKKHVVPAQSALFTAKFTKGSFATKLSDEGLSGSATVKRTSRNVLVILLFDQTLFETTKTLSYSATQGKVGVAK